MTDFQRNSAGYLANHMARLFATGLARRIRPMGLAPAQFMVLLELWDRDGRSQADLVASLDVEQATMANTLARMERDGLIERRGSGTDRRSRLVYVTEAARQRQAEAMAAARSQNEAAFLGFSPDERQAFLDLMRRAIANMRRD